MPTAFAADQARRPLALLAAWLVVLQVLLAGLAIGQAGALSVAEPIDAAAICHGAGDAAPGGTGTPDTGKAWHLCCTACTSGTAGVAPPAAHVSLLEPRAAGHLLPSSGFTIVRAPGAVRAGPSQAPPGRA
jgi:Protein of unknown function (DUF2946)